MTKTELLNELREVVRDRVQPYRWSDTRLISLLAEGEDKFCEETGFFVDKTNFSITTEAGVRRYSFSPRIIEILQVWEGDRRLAKFTQILRPQNGSIIENTVPSNWQVDTESGVIIFYEPPTAGLVLSLRVWRYPRKSFSDDAVTSPEIRLQFQRAMIEYAAWKLYNDHDAEVGSPVTADEHLKNWKQYISDGGKAFRRLQGQESTCEPNPIYSFS